MKPVTEFGALVHLISRVINEKGYAIDMVDGHRQCTYDKNVNGGCAIGAHLPDNTAAGFGGTVGVLFKMHPGYREYFRNPDSPYWRSLQYLHDILAINADRKGEEVAVVSAWLDLIYTAAEERSF